MDRCGDSDRSEAPRERHAVIAGTGRAGTSFLVRLFDACGLETGVAESNWFQRARAGLEHRLDSRAPLPYVVKDPWLFAYCQDLNLARLKIDAVILPMRELMSAAESRILQERMALVERSARERPEGQVATSTPGGVVYSLDVVDQARVLAVGFHNLLHWALVNELPVYLLSFPRLVEDVDYLLGALWPWLGEHCTEETARRAFDAVASPDAVRVREPPEPPPAEPLVLRSQRARPQRASSRGARGADRAT